MEVVLWSPCVGFGDMMCFLIVALLTTVPCEIRADAAQPSLSAAIQWNSAALQGVRDAKLGGARSCTCVGHRPRLHVRRMVSLR
jgi:hypothetical protein